MEAALIPAAGLSSRMGRYKPLLPLGRTDVITTVIGLFKRAGIREVIVVTGHNHDHLAPVVTAAGGRPLFNPDYASGMFSSIRAGVAGLPGGTRGFFLLPADIPAIRPATIGRIHRTFKENPEALVIPEFQEQTKGQTGNLTGHPPLIPSRLIPAVAQAGPEGNLRQILFSDKAGIIRLPVHDRGILMDADTPRGYDAVKAKYETLDIPDEAECRSIIHGELGEAPGICAHLTRVSTTALTLVRAIAPNALTLNPALIRAGALLHDIKRKEKDHARAGERLLLDLGFPGVARIVADHMDLVPGPELDEAQIVYLADKLCDGDRLDLDYPRRFHEKANRFPHVKKEIFNRLETARIIHARVESAAGRPLGEILG
ncbi:MAG: NTP transferase domain-containing protein [Desulfobacter sp.]|nr:MAG: NTP transferase domain-containing protein [Desulfobacter sp.]